MRCRESTAELAATTTRPLTLAALKAVSSMRSPLPHTNEARVGQCVLHRHVH